MNITSPILAATAHMAVLPADSVASLLKIVGTATGLFEIRLPKAVLTAIADTQVELRTDRNQRLAQVQDAPAIRYRVL